MAERRTVFIIDQHDLKSLTVQQMLVPYQIQTACVK
jgi:hypothetical protein